MTALFWVFISPFGEFVHCSYDIDDIVNDRFICNDEHDFWHIMFND